MLTPERLAEIRDVALPSSHILGLMTQELLDEIERLQAQNAELQKALKDCREHLDYASEGRDD